MGQVKIGISSWADPQLIECGFYPAQIKTAKERLQFYAANFQVVEMDSTYHFFPSRRNVAAWIEATPPGFVFDVKAFRLLTQHPAPFSSLPFDIRQKYLDYLPTQSNLYLHNLPPDPVEAIWERFSEVVSPFFYSGKLGVITFQFPPWFHPKPENYDYLAFCKERMSRYPLAIEFRTGSWLNDEHRQETLRFLREQQLSLVCVDEPQGLASSVLPLAEVTVSPGLVRFHGRNKKNWESHNLSVRDKYEYLYPEEELLEWVPKIRLMADLSSVVYVIFKNKHCDFAVRNARQMKILLVS